MVMGLLEVAKARSRIEGGGKKGNSKQVGDEKGREGGRGLLW